MKAALVLDAQSPSLLQHVGEINRILRNLTDQLSSFELWLFYRDNPPQVIPEIDVKPTNIKLIALKNRFSPEVYLQTLAQLSKSPSLDLILFPSDGLSEELATRLAYRLDGSSCLQVESCKMKMGKLVVSKPVYGHHLTAEFMLNHSPYCLSLAKFPCHPAEMVSLDDSILEVITPVQTDCDWMTETVVFGDSEESGLEEADRVLVVGLGAKSKDTVCDLHHIAKKMGAELGASRPVVMNAWTDIKRLIGVSGTTISPELCFVAGVSGSRVFSVGIENSQYIIAINTDPQAPIFQMADIGIVGDMKAVFVELERIMNDDKLSEVLQSGVED
jgi:electron transfer flavoprotein alpha subunit